MVCRACKTAGAYNELDHGRGTSDARKAEYLHGQCEGCDCQHKTGGDWIAMQPGASLFRS